MPQDPQTLLILTIGGAFIFFCIVIAFGAHVLPTGPMMRSPTKRGDIFIGFFSITIIFTAIWFVFSGWKYMWGTPPPPEPALFTATLSQNLTHAGFLSPEALQKPAPTKREVRAFCKEFLKSNKSANQCVVFMWNDARYLPQNLPPQPASLATMTANYVYNKSNDVDRFCWLFQGKVLENNCF